MCETRSEHRARPHGDGVEEGAERTHGHPGERKDVGDDWTRVSGARSHHGARGRRRTHAAPRSNPTSAAPPGGHA
jgi:hypothetical protein